LDLHEGDQVVFRVEGKRAALSRTPDLLDLAGSVPVPARKRGTPWSEVRHRTRAQRAQARR
jgi:antitoxin PrlF